MHVTYGFVYYICVIMLVFTLSLVIFVNRTLRKKFFDYLKKVRLMDNLIVQSVVYISFIVIFVILIDSIWTYSTLSKNLTGKFINMKVNRKEKILCLKILILWDQSIRMIISNFIEAIESFIWLKEILCSLVPHFLFALSLIDSAKPFPSLTIWKIKLRVESFE